MTERSTIKVFISSPSDVNPERSIAERVIARLDSVWKTHVRLSAVRWEREHYQAAIGFQEAIGEMAAFDVVVGILWKRIGSALRPDLYQRADGSAYESGTVFELETAIASSEQAEKPSVYLLRKVEPVTFAAEAVEEERRQHSMLLAWWDRTMRDAEGHFRRGYQSFDSLDDFETLLEGLLESHLRKSGLIPIGAAWDVATRGSPYPGLLPYDAEHADVFFGRALATAAALDDLRSASLRDTPALFVVGPSGSGKSSLVRAGLAPQIAGGYFEGVDFWRSLVVEPGADPLLALCERLYEPHGLPEIAASPQTTPQAFAAFARAAPSDAALTVNWALERASKALQTEAGGGRAPAGRMLIVIDQLETLLDGADWRPLATVLRALVEREAAWLIATLRSDRYADLQLDPDLFELRRRGALFDLPPPGAGEVAEIIKGPARAAALRFQERDGGSLAQDLAASVSGPDSLPLLQMALARLFEARDGDTLTYDAYEAMGGLDGAIAAHAEAVFASVSAAGQAMLDGLLRALVADIDEAGRLSIRTPKRDAVAGEAAAAELVDRLVEARLLVSGDGELRIAHEALLRRWGRATASPALRPDAIRLRRQIEPNLEVWRRTGLDSDLLQAGSTALAAADAIARDHPGAFPQDLEAYVARSSAVAAERARVEQAKVQDELRRARRRVYVFGLFAFVFAGVAILAIGLYRQANHSLGLALLTEAEQLLVADRPAHALAVAAAAAGAHNSGGLLGVSGALDPSSDEGVRARSIAELTQPARATLVWGLKLTRNATAVALSDDGDRFAVGDDTGAVFVGSTDKGPRPGSGAVYQPEIRLRGHSAAISGLAFTPGGRSIVTASWDGSVRLWDLQTRRGRVLCTPGSSVAHLAVDPLGRFAAASFDNGAVVVWNLASLERAPTPGLVASKASDWLVVDFSRDGRFFAASDADGVVRVYRVGDWTPIASMPTAKTNLVGVSFSQDGARLAAASQDGVVSIWQVPASPQATSAGPIATLDRAAGKLWAVRYSPDGRTLATAGWDGAVRLWDGQTFEPAGSVDANDLWIEDIAFAQHAPRLLTAGRSGTVRLWDTRTIAPIDYAVHDSPSETISGRYSPDGSRFATAGSDGAARLYAVDAAGRLQFLCKVDHDGGVTALAFSPDGKRVASGGTGQGPARAIKIWDADQPGAAGRCREDGQIPVGAADVFSLAWSRAGQGRIAWGQNDGRIGMADPNALAKPWLSAVVAHRGGVYALDFSPDGARLASGGADGKVILWSAASGQLIRVIRAAGKGVDGLRFLADGRLASAGDDDQISIWDPAAGTPLVRALPLPGGASALALSHDGAALAAGGDGRFIAIWSTHTWREVFMLTKLAGVRGAFDFDPLRGDLAFDGEAGLVRVAPGIGLPKPINVGGLGATIEGTDVYFDRIAPDVADGGGVTIVSDASAACPAAP